MINNDKKSCKLLINKAFTLIELLAVIVILAIIAVIATPIILGVIDDSKLKAKENSVNGLMEAVNMTYTKSQLSTTPLKLPITATINNGIITATDGTNSVEVTYTGEKPISGTIKIDGFGGLSASNVKYSDNYTCTKGNGENGCTNSILTLPGTVEDVMTISGETVHTGRYIFKGANPNNCIYLKEEGDTEETCNYRIVSIEADGAIKVIRDDVIRNDDTTVKKMPYDSKSSTTSGRRLNSNNTYCKQWDGSNYVDSGGTYYGCNAWSKVNGIYVNGTMSGTISDDAEINTYLNTTYYNLLDEKVRNNIITHSFNVTPNGWGNGLSSLTSLYNATMTWEGKIGLLELRDWFNASSESTCNSSLSGSGWYTGSGGTDTTYECSQKNYLYKSIVYWWLLNSAFNNRADEYMVYGEFVSSSSASTTSLSVRPVFYLSPNIQLTGSGTTENPYRIK